MPEVFYALLCCCLGFGVFVCMCVCVFNTILRLFVLDFLFVCLFVCLLFGEGVNHEFCQRNPLLFWSRGRTPADELTA